jgi:hypothetical protein
MSPLAIDFSDDDIKRGKLISPGWYRVRIDEITSALSKNGDSTNYLVKGTIIKNADTPSDTEFDGFPTPYWNFNSKAKGFMIGFFASLGIEPSTGTRYDLEAFGGKELEVMIENDLYDGRMINRINHKYRKASE